MLLRSSMTTKRALTRSAQIGMLATVAALACGCLFAPSAVAAAQQTSMHLSCMEIPPGNPEAGHFGCTATVKNVSSPFGSKPTGQVNFEALSGGGAFGPVSCKLTPLAGSEALSNCSS